jgi:hypothetical protein
MINWGEAMFPHLYQPRSRIPAGVPKKLTLER